MKPPSRQTMQQPASPDARSLQQSCARLDDLTQRVARNDLLFWRRKLERVRWLKCRYRLRECWRYFHRHQGH